MLFYIFYINLQKSWAIDQIALLNPSKIEESPSTHQNETILTPQTEAKAQEAIGRLEKLRT